MLLFIRPPQHQATVPHSISKHLMLLFISTKTLFECCAFTFQNISCYCLSRPLQGSHGRFCDISKHLMLLFIAIDPIVSLKSPAFQNISCYCLSLKILSIQQQIPQFQNISCYCLSFFKSSISHGFPSFQNISCYCLSLAFPRFLVSPLPFFPLYFLYFSIFYQPTPLSWTALLIIP